MSEGQPAVQSVERTFKIINIMANYKEISIKELSLKSALPKATVFRLLNTLISIGYAHKNPNNDMYGLSYKFLNISSKLLENFDIRNTVKPYLEKLSLLCGETVHLVEQSGNNVVYIDKFEALQNSVRMVSRIGMSLSMPCTAVGKAIMAELDDGEIKKLWDMCPTEKYTKNSITDFNEFLKSIYDVRKNGYGIDNEENEEGVYCIAATLPKIGDNPANAFSISAPVQRLNEETVSRNISLLLKTKEEISKVL